MVGDPVPQRAKPVERVVQAPTLLDARRENAVEVSPPDCRVVGIGEQRHPEPKGQFCDHAAGSDWLVAIVEILDCFVDYVHFAATKKPPVFEPARTVVCAHHIVNRVAKGDLKRLQRAIERARHRGVPRVKL